MKSCFFRY